MVIERWREEVTKFGGETIAQEILVLVQKPARELLSRTKPLAAEGSVGERLELEKAILLSN